MAGDTIHGRLPVRPVVCGLTLLVQHLRRPAMEGYARRASMTKNMGTADRIIRTLIAIGIAVLYFTGKISGILAIVLGFFAVAFLISSLVSWCPSYGPLGISTRKRPSGGTA